MSTLIVIPVYNESIEIINGVINSLLPFQFEIVIVDDGSAYSVQECFQELPITVLTHRENLGQGAALRTGFNYAKATQAEYLVTFDGDGQHTATDIHKLLAPLYNSEADVTLGSRFIEGANHNASFYRKLLFKVAALVNRWIIRVAISDTHNGLRGFNRKAISLISIKEDGMAHATEILDQIIKLRLKFKEVAVTIYYSNYSRKKGNAFFGLTRTFLELFRYKWFRRRK